MKLIPALLSISLCFLQPVLLILLLGWWLKRLWSRTKLQSFKFYLFLYCGNHELTIDFSGTLLMTTSFHMQACAHFHHYWAVFTAINIYSSLMQDPFGLRQLQDDSCSPSKLILSSHPCPGWVVMRPSLLQWCFFLFFGFVVGGWALVTLYSFLISIRQSCPKNEQRITFHFGPSDTCLISLGFKL